MQDTVHNDDYKMRLGAFLEGMKNHYAASAKAYTVRVSRFFADLTVINNAFLQYKKESDRLISSDFSYFNLINTDENAMSDYIAMMLDSRGAHGQGDLFLSIFIEFIAGKNLIVPKEKYSVHREYWANGRIDIYLQSENTAVIIENKPYASDQPAQLSRYLEDIKKVHDNIFVIYLSPGNGPSESSIALSQLWELRKNNRFITIPLFTLANEFLKKCAQACESHKFKFFIDDFKSYLLKNFIPVKKEKNESNQ